MKAKTCQNCCRHIEAIASNRTILICSKKQGSQGKYFVVDPNATCGSFKPAENVRQTCSQADGSKLIPLTQGKFAIVDADDYDRLAKYKWCATKNGQTFYACRASRGKKIFMHREIMKPPKGLQVDHIDRNALNNRKTNLRPCTKAQNNRNTGPRRNSSSTYKGVFWEKCCRKWCARIRP
ncbi:MAG: HNH endonuclease signature motif containing protein, partial [Planctomycetota bacterium]